MKHHHTGVLLAWLVIIPALYQHAGETHRPRREGN
jgi:hypothetical protein